MELTLFESSVDAQGQGGVFVLYIPSQAGIKAGEQIDRILSVLHRDGFRDCYEKFVSGLPQAHYVKFKVCVGTSDKDIELKSSGGLGPHLCDRTKVLKFAEVDAWDANGAVPSARDLMERFSLPSISTVMPHVPYLAKYISLVWFRKNVCGFIIFDFKRMQRVPSFGLGTYGHTVLGY